ncbi:unnamed protein product [Trichobilharzia szidati]|nr:unnamed protein product [Trichobilharzia szidati]
MPCKETYMNLFKQLDKNGDNVVSSEELKSGLKELGMDEDCIKDVMRILDSDKDGKITLAEYKKAVGY